jgi:hypothetical protein
MNRAKRIFKLRSWLFSSKVYVFFWCLIIATLFWFLLALNNRYTAEITVPVVYMNMPNGTFLDEKLPKEIVAEISGSGYQLFSYFISPEKANIKLDLRKAGMSPVGANKRAFLTTSTGIDFFNKEHSDILLLRIKPDTIYFNFPDRAFKSVPIHLNALLDFEKQFDLVGNIELNPDSVQISGPKLMLDTIGKIETELLILKNLINKGTYSVNLKPINSNINYIPAMISATVNVEKFTESILEVPVYAEHLLSKDSIQLIPNRVKLKFLVSLSNFSKVKANQFKVSANIDDLKNININKLKLSLTMSPKMVKNVKIEPEYIDFIIRKK